MTAAFSIIKLVNDEALIEGTDSSGNEGQMQVSTSEWDEICAKVAHHRAEAGYKETVDEFFKPLTDKADELKKSLEVPKSNISHFVLEPGVEGTTAKVEVAFDLNRDSTLIMLVQQGHFNMLKWVGDGDTLVVLEPTVPLPVLVVDEPAVLSDEVAEAIAVLATTED